MLQQIKNELFKRTHNRKRKNKKRPCNPVRIFNFFSSTKSYINVGDENTVFTAKKTINPDENKEGDKRNAFERGLHRFGKRCRERGDIGTLGAFFAIVKISSHYLVLCMSPWPNWALSWA